MLIKDPMERIRMREIRVSILISNVWMELIVVSPVDNRCGQRTDDHERRQSVLHWSTGRRADSGGTWIRNQTAQGHIVSRSILVQTDDSTLIRAVQK
jgi:hypothetical protein